MTTQPTHRTPLPTRPALDPARAQLMGALALAEHLVSLGEPVPAQVHIRFDCSGAALVELMLYRAPEALRNYRERFGGQIRERLNISAGYAPSLLAELTGTAYDGPFRVWCLTELTECEFAARFVDEHGPYEHWSEDSHRVYEAGIAAIKAKAGRP